MAIESVAQSGPVGAEFRSILDLPILVEELYNAEESQHAIRDPEE